MKKEDLREGMIIRAVGNHTNIFEVRGNDIVATKDNSYHGQGRSWPISQQSFDLFEIVSVPAPVTLTTPIKEQNRFEGLDL